MSDEPRSLLRAGAIIGGRFRVDRLVGKGGMGEVYAAKNLATGREVALKRLRTSGDESPERRRRFLREARAANAIAHPNVIEVLDVFEDEDGAPVMVMELLRGETLAALEQRRGPLPLGEAASILAPALAAVRAAHEKGIVHRDLKPENVFLAETPGGRVPKVLDFGIAKVLDPAALGAESRGGGTRTEAILGTPHYMSFEQAMSEKDIDRRADVWAAGVILFEALTGRRPLVFENLGQMYTAFLQGTVPSIREALPDLPGDLAGLVDRCLQKQRDARLEDLGPLIEARERHAGAPEGAAATAAPASSQPPQPTVEASITTARPRRARWPAIVGAAAILAGAIAALHGAPSPRPEQAVGTLVAGSPSAIDTAPPRAVTAVPSVSAAPPTSSSPSASAAPSAAIHVPRTTAPTGARSRPPPPAATEPTATPPQRGIVEKLPY